MPNGITLPYGNAFIVNTPSLDRYGLQLYQEQRQKEAEAAQENKILDQNMQSELGKIRSADTPEFIEQYQKYKDIKKQLYNPKIQRNATEINKISQAANVELAKAMQVANGSIEYKEKLKQLQTERARNPIYFNDDFQQRYEAAQNTPLSKLEKHPTYGDLSNMDNFYYKGNVTNLQPILDKAKGQLKEIGEPKINENFSPTEREITKYKGLNSPRDYYNLVIGSLRGSRAQKDLLASYNFTPEEAQSIISEYNDKVKNNPDYKAAYGDTALNFPDSADYSDVGQVTKLLAMEHGIQALRPETKRETKKQENALQNQSFHEKNIKLNAELQGNSLNSPINDVHGGVVADVKALNNQGVSYATGSQLKSDATNRILTAIKTKYPSKQLTQDDIKVGVDADNNVQVFYSDKYLGKHPSQEKPLITVLTPTDFNLPVQVDVKGKRVVVNQGGKQPAPDILNHSKDEFKAAGWTDDQINKALRAGKIKLK